MVPILLSKINPSLKYDSAFIFIENVNEEAVQN